MKLNLLIINFLLYKYTQSIKRAQKNENNAILL